MSQDGAPEPVETAAVWTGRVMIVWGGLGSDGRRRGTGATYDPIHDSWTPVSQVGAPSPRWRFASVWTGSEMIIWGGSTAEKPSAEDGAAYDPVRNVWRPITPSPFGLFGKLAVAWTGSTMIVWNGFRGAAYDPASDSWTPISSDIGTRSRGDFATIWTGKEMIIWGGTCNQRPTRYCDDGARYDPYTDTWSPVPAKGGPGPTYTAGQVDVWTGREMLIWPGGDGIGGAYRPYWLTVRSPTQAYGVDDSPLFVAQPGELYRVVQFQDDWALVQADGDPPSLEEWVAVDDRVELSTPFPPDTVDDVRP